jgi:hypothetical protein
MNQALERETRKLDDQRKLQQEEGLRAKALESMHDVLSSLKSNTLYKDLCFSGHKLDRMSLSLLCDAFELNTSCESLSICGHDMNQIDASRLSGMLASNHSIRRLLLPRNMIGPGLLQCFGELILENTTLEVLSLRLNDLTSTGSRCAEFYSLCQCIGKNTGIRSLDLSFCSLTQDCLFALAKELQVNQSIVSVLVSGNVDDFGARLMLDSICARNRKQFEYECKAKAAEIRSMTGADRESSRYSKRQSKEVSRARRTHDLYRRCVARRLQDLKIQLDSAKEHRKTVARSLFERRFKRLDRANIQLDLSGTNS